MECELAWPKYLSGRPATPGELRMSLDFVCPNCKKPVSPIAQNAMMNAATKEWQHRECWTEGSKPVDSAAPDNLSGQGSVAERWRKNQTS